MKQDRDHDGRADSRKSSAAPAISESNEGSDGYEVERPPVHNERADDEPAVKAR